VGEAGPVRGKNKGTDCSKGRDGESVRRKALDGLSRHYSHSREGKLGEDGQNCLRGGRKAAEKQKKKG